jgi:hypothetical protein
MTREVETEIWKERLRLTDARREKMNAAMEAYDRDVHLPAVKALCERCKAETGHTSDDRWYNNGLGRSWQQCKLCGATINEEYD